jgi:hypothetical protein
MIRTPLARLAFACAGLLVVTQAPAQGSPPPGGDTVNPWKSSADAPKDGAGETVNPWNGAAAGASATPPSPGEKATPAKGAAKVAKGNAGKAPRAAARKRGRADRALNADGPIASSPSFRMLPGGVTRIFLEVSRKVDVSENKAKGRVVYHLKGAQVPTRTSRLPLLTGFFITPVDRVELTEQGDGVDLAIDLHEALDPRFEVIETPRGMVLHVDFPRGSESPPDASSGNAAPSKKRGTATRTIETKGAPADAGD